MKLVLYKLQHIYLYRFSYYYYFLLLAQDTKIIINIIIMMYPDWDGQIVKK